MKTHFFSNVFTLNIVFGSLLSHLNSAGSGETLDVNVKENLYFLKFIIFYPAVLQTKEQISVSLHAFQAP